MSNHLETLVLIILMHKVKKLMHKNKKYINYELQ